MLKLWSPYMIAVMFSEALSRFMNETFRNFENYFSHLTFISVSFFTVAMNNSYQIGYCFFFEKPLATLLLNL